MSSRGHPKSASGWGGEEGGDNPGGGGGVLTPNFGRYMCRGKVKNGPGLRNELPVERENAGLPNELEPFELENAGLRNELEPF